MKQKKIFTVLTLMMLMTAPVWGQNSSPWKMKFDFHEGLARVENFDEKWGYIDKTGKLVIPYEWAGARNFSKGKAAVADRKDNYGFINKQGKLVTPCQYTMRQLIDQGKWVR